MEKWVEILDKIGALKKQVLLSAPSEYRKELCAHCLNEATDLVESVLKMNGGQR